MSKFKFTEPVLIKAGDERLRLGIKQEFPRFDCRVIWEKSYQHLLEMKKQRNEMLEMLDRFMDITREYTHPSLDHLRGCARQLIKEATEI